MKCNLNISASSSMSEGYSIKLRVFVLVINTANFINVRATPSLGITHSLVTPVTLFTTYSLLGIMVIASARQHFASSFLQMYALVACCSVQLSLSFVVFRALKQSEVSKQQVALVLQGVLPMISVVILLIDLTGVIFSNREELPPPSSITSTTISPTQRGTQ